MDQRPQHRADALNLVGEKVVDSLQHIVTGDNILNWTPVIQALRSIIDKWDLMKQKIFHKAKNTVKGTKQQITELERLFPKPTSDRGLKYIRNLKNSNNPIKN